MLFVGTGSESESEIRSDRYVAFQGEFNPPQSSDKRETTLSDGIQRSHSVDFDAEKGLPLSNERPSKRRKVSVREKGKTIEKGSMMGLLRRDRSLFVFLLMILQDPGESQKGKIF